jgi:hypothetical protein
VLQTKAVVRGSVWGVVDGDESGSAADYLGRGHSDFGALRAGLVGAGALGLGTGDVGALVCHGALAVAAAVWR